MTTPCATLRRSWRPRRRRPRQTACARPRTSSALLTSTRCPRRRRRGRACALRLASAAAQSTRRRHPRPTGALLSELLPGLCDCEVLSPLRSVCSQGSPLRLSFHFFPTQRPRLQEADGMRGGQELRVDGGDGDQRPGVHGADRVQGGRGRDGGADADLGPQVQGPQCRTHLLMRSLHLSHIFGAASSARLQSSCRWN